MLLIKVTKSFTTQEVGIPHKHEANALLITLSEQISITYLRSPSTSGRSFVMAITSANNVTKVVMNATGELRVETEAGT